MAIGDVSFNTDKRHDLQNNTDMASELEPVKFIVIPLMMNMEVMVLEMMMVGLSYKGQVRGLTGGPLLLSAARGGGVYKKAVR